MITIPHELLTSRITIPHEVQFKEGVEQSEITDSSD